MAGPTDGVFFRETVRQEMNRIHRQFVFFQRLLVLRGGHARLQQRLALGGRLGLGADFSRGGGGDFRQLNSTFAEKHFV